MGNSAARQDKTFGLAWARLSKKRQHQTQGQSRLATFALMRRKEGYPSIHYHFKGVARAHLIPNYDLPGQGVSGDNPRLGEEAQGFSES